MSLQQLEEYLNHKITGHDILLLWPTEILNFLTNYKIKLSNHYHEDLIFAPLLVRKCLKCSYDSKTNKECSGYLIGLFTHKGKKKLVEVCCEQTWLEIKIESKIRTALPKFNLVGWQRF